jgi:formamidopyrimidine-DNA glycosylase
MDQTIILGLGNIYASEILFASKISPFRPGKTITKTNVETILKNARTILDAAIAERGSTISNYQAPNGPGNYQKFHQVYGKASLPCPVCQTPLEKALINQRTCVYCPKCQQ